MDLSDFLKKNKLKEGDKVEVLRANNKLKGTIIPSKEKDILTLKLDSGYNTGLKVSNDLSVKKVDEGKKVGKPKAVEIKKDSLKPTISILHTGGTIASRVNYEKGGVYSAFEAEDLITMYPELTDEVNFDTRLIMNIMSEDLKFKDYQALAKAIQEETKKGIKGIIIGHGTDTMAYTAAALSFMLENLCIPVILVGSQRSSDRGSSDAAMNLLSATRFIAKTDFCGVAICMHENTDDTICVILPACKTRKMHSSRRDAFKAINDRPIARINYETKEITMLKKDYCKRNCCEGKKLGVKDGFEEKVGILKARPNLLAEEIEFFEKNKYKGLVLEGSGLGHFPTNPELNPKNNKALKSLIKSGCIVVDTTQCLYGRVHLTVYSNLRVLKEMGVISGEDMLPETAFIKLSWLLGNYSVKEAKELIGKNLQGEITPCTDIKGFETGELNE